MRRGLTLRLACTLLTSVWLASVWLASPCAAQSTGGSFGSSGGSWGSSSRGSGSSRGSADSRRSSHDYGGSSSSDHGGSVPSHSGGSGSGGGSDAYYPPSGPTREEIWRSEYRSAGEPPITDRERAATTPAVPLWAEYLSVTGLLFALTFAPGGISRLVRRRRERARARLAWVSVGLDWTVRERLQRRLAELASSLSIDTPRERARAARAIVELLREHIGGACYAQASDRICSTSEGPAELARIAADLRARFTHETRGQRAIDDVPELAARADEGPGLLVVTLAIGSSSDRRDIGDIVDRASLDAFLAAFVPEGGQGALDGLEVVWSPAEDADRMSSYELERFYPELARLSDTTTVGSVRCKHCSAPRPRELERCPRCGASDAA